MPRRRPEYTIESGKRIVKTPNGAARRKLRTVPTEEQFKRIAINCQSIVVDMAKKIGVSVMTLYAWKREGLLPFWDKCRAAGDEASIDFSESKLKQNIRKGKEASIFFHLKCKGKHRGYIEKMILGTEESSYTSMSDDDLLKVLEQRKTERALAGVVLPSEAQVVLPASEVVQPTEPKGKA